MKRRSFWKYLPAFLIPASVKATEATLAPSEQTPITEEMLLAISRDLNLPELEKLLAALKSGKYSTRDRYRRRDDAFFRVKNEFVVSGKTLVTSEKGKEINKIAVGYFTTEQDARSAGELLKETLQNYDCIANPAVKDSYFSFGVYPVYPEDIWKPLGYQKGGRKRSLPNSTMSCFRNLPKYSQQAGN